MLWGAIASLILLGIGEGILRIAGVQAPEPFFTTHVDPTGAVWVRTNPAAGKAWFPDPSWDPALGQPRPQLFEAVKPPNTVRIFVVGESAAYGTPFPDSGSWPRLLETSLALSRGPADPAVQVINCAIRASTLSLAVGVIPEIRAWSPDLFVVYAGHNEYYGPRGPNWFERLRLFKLLRSAQTKEFTGTRVLGLRADIAFPPADESRGPVARRFGESVNTFIAAAAPTPVMVVMPHANEADLAPLQSLLSTQLAAEGAQAESLVAAVESDPTLAPERAAEAAQLAGKLPNHAGLAHVLGLDALAQGKLSAAEAYFQQSIDLDMVPIRATSPIRTALTAAIGTSTATICDPEAAFRAESTGGALGHAVFLDHVHLSLHGGYLLAQTLIECMGKRPELGIERATIPSEPDVLSALGISDIDRALTAASMAHYFQNATVQASPSRGRSVMYYQQSARMLQQGLAREERVALVGPPEEVHTRLARSFGNDPARQAAELRAAVLANPGAGSTRAQLALLLHAHGVPAAKEEAIRALVTGATPEQAARLRQAFGFPTPTE